MRHRVHHFSCGLYPVVRHRVHHFSCRQYPVVKLLLGATDLPLDWGHSMALFYILPCTQARYMRQSLVYFLMFSHLQVLLCHSSGYFQLAVTKRVAGRRWQRCCFVVSRFGYFSTRVPDDARCCCKKKTSLARACAIKPGPSYNHSLRHVIGNQCNACRWRVLACRAS